MIWRTLLFLVALYLILYLLVKSLGAFFRQIGRHQTKQDIPRAEEQKPILRLRNEDIEDAKFEDLPEDKQRPENPNQPAE